MTEFNLNDELDKFTTVEMLQAIIKRNPKFIAIWHEQANDSRECLDDEMNLIHGKERFFIPAAVAFINLRLEEIQHGKDEYFDIPTEEDDDEEFA